MKLTNPATTMAFILFASMNHHDYGAAGASMLETGSTSSVYYEDSNSTTAATVVESDTPNGNAAKELEEDTITSTTEIDASSSKQSYLRSSFNVPTLTKNVIKSDEESHEDHTSVHEQVELSRSRLLDIDNPLKPTDRRALSPSDYPTFVTRSFSEEKGGYSDYKQGPIKGLYCRGSYCDNKILYGTSLPGKLDRYNSYWTSSFSEEGNNSRTCLRGMFVTQMKCSGGYCDNLALRCSKFATNSGFQIDHNKKKETASFSEEGQGKGSCGTGYAVIGISCSGRYCDNLRLICAAWGQK